MDAVLKILTVLAALGIPAVVISVTVAAMNKANERTRLRRAHRLEMRTNREVHRAHRHAQMESHAFVQCKPTNFGWSVTRLPGPHQ